MTIQTKRICPGEYVVTDGRNQISVSCIDFGHGREWIAARGSRSTDPLPTKREAVFQAGLMLNEMEAR